MRNPTIVASNRETEKELKIQLEMLSLIECNATKIESMMVKIW